ncbi:TolC family protein [Flavobacterium aquatile]|uniref:Transporter n=1 Tax=Flavobacterium aquatile LMG 4008 = ATCC 11947 TaxID=1453498 RepID=A0A095U3V5_9FLAO|nr:TolC family protein [Flavobacterium aquatile]KGD69268.1 transporter [Flavobacterium aquatile LMG 4008 = ATCC 11947]OXA69521.1 transporter [Flavobacterium aquatile] [Flavobacterium aquatile LMG 4008 = ATCC 11947]GEC77775.1 transporter [Flavobacterium aquatile]
MNFKTLVFLLFTTWVSAQEKNLQELTYNEYLGFVKKYHPMVKSANLEVTSAQANLMMARGGFDPKIEVDFDKKQFKDTEYYSLLNSSFKIPTWYGIEVKAGFDNSEGVYVNPQNTLPNQGLTSLGISVPLGQGLLINQRMADLRKAKIQIQLSQAERKLQAIEVLYNASVAYFNWKRNYSEVQLYTEYLQNAEIRFKGVSSLIINGDKPAIDSVEAGIIVRNRKLNLEDSQLKLMKSKLELSNFLWLENNVPLELQDTIIPEENLENTIKETLKTNELLVETISIENHPKINSLQSKLGILEVERQLKANSLLPKIDVGYSYLSEPNYWDDTNFDNYKVGVNFSFPLFLRKERGGLQLAKFKIQDTQYDLDLERVQLKNKITTQQTEINSLERQRKLISDLVKDYNTMLSSEERLFSFGESSIFLINSRENNLVSSQLSELSLENRYLISNAELFKIMANPD